MKFRGIHFIFSLIFGTMIVAGNLLPVKAAQTIYFIAGPVRVSLNISSLEAFATDGTVDRRLADYLRIAGATEEEKAGFREVLLKRVEIEPTLLSRLLRTEMGEDLLSRWGRHITIQGGRNGK